MEQRKLIKLGNSSFAIALPKEWVDKAGLKKGDNIFIERNPNGELIILPEFKKISGEKLKVLDFSDVEDSKAIRRELTNAYVQDYNRLEIKGVNAKNKAQIKEHANYLMGLEIMENNGDTILIKDFFDLNEVNIENFVRRIDNNIRSMLEELEKGIKAGKLGQKQFSEIQEADDDVNKFYLLINKIFIKGVNNPSVLSMLKIDLMTLFNDWWTVYHLEHVGDEIKRIARLLKQEEVEHEKMPELHETFLKMKEMYIDCVNSYYKKDKTISLRLTSMKDDMMKISDSLSKDKNSTLAKIGEKFKQITDITYQISKVTLYSFATGEQK